MNNVTWEEFEKTCYHTQYSIVVPLVNRMKINKLEFFNKGKLDNNKIRIKLIFYLLLSSLNFVRKNFHTSKNCKSKFSIHVFKIKKW